MLAIEVEFLTGRFSASAHDDRARPEWPPHPARIFSAIVAAWADVDDPSPDERGAITRLETLGDPEIVASACSERTQVAHFVPVNDTAVIRTHVDRMERVGALSRALAPGALDAKQSAKLARQLAKDRQVDALVSADGKGNETAARELFPEQRPKQARTFPSVTPESPVVVYQWPEADLSDVERDALDRVLARVTRIGHSSSLVACRLAREMRTATFVPDRTGDAVLRSVRPGQLDALEDAFRRHQGSGPRTLPSAGVPYRSGLRATDPPRPLVPSTAGDWQVIEFAPGSRQRPMTATVTVARAVRGAILAHAATPHTELLSGHAAEGGPTRRPHLAVVPLPFVGHARASGALVGVALVLPSEAGPDDRERVALFDALAVWEAAHQPSGDDVRGLEIRLGKAGIIRGAFALDPSLGSLRRGGWTRPSRRWVSATPVALSQHPGSLRRGNAAKRTAAWTRAEELVARECEFIGLPAPRTVRLDLAPMLAGAAPASSFPAFVQRDRRSSCDAARALVHAEVSFDDDVRGPLLLGAGRFFGLGLMRPMDGADG